MGGSFPVFFTHGKHPADLLAALHKNGVSHRPHLLDLAAPAEQFRVKLAGRIDIVGRQLVPAKRARLAQVSSPQVLFRLPERKGCTAWILQHCHASHVEDIEGGLEHLAAQ